MKLTYTYNVMVVLLSVVVYTWAQQDATTPHEYCIIQGDNVIMRSQPSLKAKVVGRLDKYEFVYCIGKTEEKTRIDADENYWYKIRNCDNKEGWIFGKYLWFIDDKEGNGKFFKKMIEIEIINSNFCNPKNKCKIYKLNKEYNHYIIDFESEEKLKYAKYGVMGGRWLAFYKIIDNNFVETIHISNHQYYFFKNYIIIYTKTAIRVFNTENFMEGNGKPHYNIPCKYYAHTGFYLYEDILKEYGPCIGNEIDCDVNSDMEFNPQTMEVIVNVRIEEGKLLKQEKYKFSDGKFVKIE